MTSETANSPLALEIIGLRKSYSSPGHTPGFDLSIEHFALKSGEEAALFGSSGSGKSSFLNLIAGILAPDSGRVVVDGRDFTALSEASRDQARAEKIGYVFQNFNLLQGLTALENVAIASRFGRGLDQGRAKRLLERVGLGDRLSSTPSKLSVGQQQRIAVARAIVNRPALVLADEPTGNLDRETADEVIALMREVCREERAALLVVSHDSEILGRFSRVEKISDLARKDSR